MASGKASFPVVDAAIRRALQSRFEDPQWVIAFSGGLDSTALLLAAHRLARDRLTAPPLLALHVNHRLAAEADTWEAHCRDVCRQLHIPCRVERIQVVQAGSGLESAARDARYAVFRAALDAGGSLLMAHHQDDQVETFFLRLFRGAGVQGLAGIPGERALGNGRLLRPFLALERDRLQDYVLAHNQGWIEDGSNADLRHDRNYLRHRVLPLIAGRWPGYRIPISRAMSHLAELETTSASLAPPTRYNAMGDPGVDCQLLSRLAPAEAAIALRHWLRERGCLPPPREPLMEFLRQLRSAAAAAAPRLQRREWCLQRHGDTVYLLPQPPGFVAPPPRRVTAGEYFDLAGVGRVAISGAGEGDEGLTLGFRRGGERIRLQGEVHHRSLKTLLQAAGVPPWWRNRVPLLFAADRLLVVGDLWQAENPPATLAWERAVRYVAD